VIDNGSYGGRVVEFEASRCWEQFSEGPVRVTVLVLAPPTAMA
jgi:hypothetical protein